MASDRLEQLKHDLGPLHGKPGDQAKLIVEWVIKQMDVAGNSAVDFRALADDLRNNTDFIVKAVMAPPPPEPMPAEPPEPAPAPAPPPVPPPQPKKRGHKDE